MASSSFASQASHASLLALSSPLSSNLSASALIRSASDLAGFRLPGVMVLSLSLSVALLFLSLGLVARDLGRPTRLAPLRWVRVNGVEDGRRALVGGANVWLWGCAVASAFHLAQVVMEIRYQRLAVGILSTRFWGDMAFICLWTSALLSLLSSLYSTPLLRPSALYTPPKSLSAPVAAPVLSILATLFLPTALAVAVLAAFASTAAPVAELHGLLSDYEVIFSQSDGQVPDPAAMEQALGKAWDGTLVQHDSRVKVVAVVVLFVLVLAVEAVVGLRFWKLVHNAKVEELRPALTSFALPLSIHPSHNLKPPTLSDAHSLHLEGSSLLPSQHFFIPLPPPSRSSRPSSCSKQSNRAGYTLASYPRPPSSADQASYLTPSTLTSSKLWPDDVPLGGLAEDGVPSYPAAAFLVRKMRESYDAQQQAASVQMQRGQSGMSGSWTESAASSRWTRMRSHDSLATDVDEDKPSSRGSTPCRCSCAAMSKRSSSTSSTGSLASAYAGPSASCLRTMRATRLKDASSLLSILLVYALVLYAQSAFAPQIASRAPLALFMQTMAHLVPLLAALLIVLAALCRSLSADDDSTLFAKTRWGRDLGFEGWSIPTEDARVVNHARV